MPWSSNGTFLVELTPAGCDPEDPAVEATRAVYKPVRGERPLWDFPNGLYQREVAAYVLAEAIEWDIVPPTLVREEAPLGVGSLQLFIDADFQQHYFTLLENEGNHAQLARICAFDLLVNNTDRKSGHCLIDSDGHIWAIDNGLSFSLHARLRTVIWDFAGEPVPDDLLAAVAAVVDSSLESRLSELLDPFERDAVGARARALLREGRFPVDETGHAYPWPLV
ncbi:MAG: SCO1664 family protein [Acidimicrobiales bacterium]